MVFFISFNIKLKLIENIKKSLRDSISRNAIATKIQERGKKIFYFISVFWSDVKIKYENHLIENEWKCLEKIFYRMKLKTLFNKLNQYESKTQIFERKLHQKEKLFRRKFYQDKKKWKIINWVN